MYIGKPATPADDIDTPEYRLMILQIAAARDGIYCEPNGLTPKEAWWAGYRAGKGLPSDMPRQEAVEAPPVPQSRTVK